MSQKAKMRINIDISSFTGIYKGVLTYEKQYKSADGMPRQDFPEFRKVLVPLRKFAFQNYIYQRFTNETGEPNLQ